MADLRLAELLAALSQMTDLGLGQPPETAIRSCLLATGLARRMEIDEPEIGAIYYTPSCSTSAATPTPTRRRQWSVATISPSARPAARSMLATRGRCSRSCCSALARVRRPPPGFARSSAPCERDRRFSESSFNPIARSRFAPLTEWVCHPACSVALSLIHISEPTR